MQAGGNVVIGSFYWQNRSDSNLASPGWGTLESIDPFRSLIDPITGAGGATYRSGVLGQVTSGDVATAMRWCRVWARSRPRASAAASPPTRAATVVAEWSDGQPLVGYRILPGGQRLVAVSLFPASGAAAGGDTQILWENAVVWAGRAGGPKP